MAPVQGSGTTTGARGAGVRAGSSESGPAAPTASSFDGPGELSLLGGCASPPLQVQPGFERRGQLRAKLIILSVSSVLLLFGTSASAFADSSADQTNGNTGGSGASNGSSTNQGAGQSQSTASSCSYGCGGSGQA